MMTMPEDPTEMTRSLMRTRHTMLLRIRDWDDREAWRDFFEMYHQYVYRHARGAGLPHHECEDLVQEVFQKVAEKCDDLEIREQPGAFRRWLGNQVRWRIIDKVRQRRGTPGSPDNAYGPHPDDDRTELLNRIPDEFDEEIRWERDWQAQLLDTALERLSRKVSPEHLQVFQLHQNQGWSLVKVARELGMSLASAYAINSRLKKRLRMEVETLRASMK